MTLRACLILLVTGHGARAQGRQASRTRRTCYGRRYPDLAYHLCKDECNAKRSTAGHFQKHGRQEGRLQTRGSRRRGGRSTRRDCGQITPSRAVRGNGDSSSTSTARVRVPSPRMRPRELQNDDSRAGKVGSKTITAGLQRGSNESVRSAFVRNTQKLVQHWQFRLFGTTDPCARLPY